MSDVENSTVGRDRAPLGKFTRNLGVATLVVCLGSLQFGYHIAELNAPQQSMTCPHVQSLGSSDKKPDCIDMTDVQFGAVTAIFSVGGLIGSLLAGSMADLEGRKRVALLANLVLMSLSYFMSRASTYQGLLWSRLGVGFGCGVNIVLTSLFINEIAPPDLRGALGTMNQLSINLGILLTQTVALRLATVEKWRYIFIVGWCLSVINIIGWLFVRESPRWLFKRDRAQAANVLRHLRTGHSEQDIEAELEQWAIEESETSTEGPTMASYLTSVKYKKPRTVILMILTGQQFCGINSIIFYGVKIVSQLLPEYSKLVNFGISIVNVVVTFMSSTLIEHYGRKPLLMVSTAIMSLMALLIAVSIVNKLAVLLVTSIFVYIASFAIGLGPIPLLIIGELSDKPEAAVAQSFGTACNWLATFCVGYLFPPLDNLLGGYTYVLFALFALWLTNYIYHRVPETKNKTNHRDVWAHY
ncbi:Vvs1p KNAG_0M00610 [Huiozyma naganishii CBS 8797]|uniref:Major facilitator superfamily (MFS) profile domain-containing protein n=1 Tax=Huiozyma naganishii (strain ATCC MYA-139 / BCRC 22969 / CBS 8797 / KCTC 17520 / NBRC 10181 / NCYC 3082 / Yp74L-3) TaxID=1071383 RepID=J7SAP2_HUIN7|nr:hypothetical protein KNAG_0M00610 [Kazachstania naganishii CBS 8797]CCK72914.1 hypothetical protein KNAG_0M00610 [Kazachstania naganishii CBS 8797]